MGVGVVDSGVAFLFLFLLFNKFIKKKEKKEREERMIMIFTPP